MDCFALARNDGGRIVPALLPTLLLDLDGTLVDPAPGIIGSVRHALASLGHEPPPFEALHWVIGPPLRESFPILMGDPSRAEEAVAAYRAVYSTTGLYEATPYPGMREALATFKESGARMFVCTSKPRPFALRVLEHFGFSSLFDAVYGAELDGRFDDKAELLAHLLGQEKIAPESACMIGDRKFDIGAARASGVRCVGALWGYGGEAELRDAGADALCAAPGALARVVAGLFA